MILIPALDIANQTVVLRGCSGLTEVADDPVIAARDLRERGAEFFQLRLVGDPAEDAAIVARFVDAGLACSVSAAIRDVATAERWLTQGVDRALLEVELLDDAGAIELFERCGARLAVEVVAEVADVVERLAELAARGVRRVQLRRADCEGVPVEGPDLELVDRALEVGDLELFVEARIRSRTDLAALAERYPRGLAGVVLADACRALVKAG